MEMFEYRTEIKGREFRHSVYAMDIESSVQKWLTKIEDLVDQVYSFDKSTVNKIKEQFSKTKHGIFKTGEVRWLAYELNDHFQTTYIDTIKRPQPHFIAKVHYLRTEDGGRKSYAGQAYRPHFQLTEDSIMTSAEQIFVDKDKVYPGESAIAEIRILSVEAFAGQLYEGQKFLLGEVRKIVAKGEIIEVINDTLKKVSS